jgi:tetratricopeptide (TPR) repeat protein
VAIDPNDAGCHWVLANLLAYERCFDEADAGFAKAFELDPNEADAWATLSDITLLAGRVEESLEQVRKAFRLNPFPASWYYLTLGQAQYAARDYEGAIETLRRDETYRTSSRRFLAASLAQLGRFDEARTEVEMFLVSNPHFTTRHWVATEPFRDDATLGHFVDGFRKAGLPD